MKDELYQALMGRMADAYEAGFHLEAISYEYALLEDRLNSALRQSGGDKYGNGRPIRNLGKKIQILNDRRASDSLLNANFDDALMQRVHDWKEDRNNLMHALASGEMSLAELDKLKYLVAQRGKKLVADAAAAARRLKKHRDKA